MGLCSLSINSLVCGGGCCSVAKLCLTLRTAWTAACMPGLPIPHCLQEFAQVMSIELAMPSYHLILCHPLLLLPSIFPNSRVFSNEMAVCIMWPKYWSFRFSTTPFNEYWGLICVLGRPSCKMNVCVHCWQVDASKTRLCSETQHLSVIKAKDRPLHVTSIPKESEATDVYQQFKWFCL